MKKQVLIIIILGFLYLKSYSQQQWNWANFGYGDVLQAGYSIASDANGNVYVSGQFWSDNVNFPHHPNIYDPNPWKLNRAGSPSPNMFVASYDVSSGNLNWAATANGLDSDETYGYYNEAYSICTGSDGIYLTGVYGDGGISFDNAKGSGTWFLSGNGYDRTFFLVKYGISGPADGIVQWAVNIEPASESGVAYSATDPLGNVYITGDYLPNSGGITFYDKYGNPYTLKDNSNSNNAVFIASYDSQGNFRWAEDAGGLNGNDMGTCVTTDNLGNVYLAGYFESTSITFPSSPICIGTNYSSCTGTCSPSSKTLPNTGSATLNDVNMFLVKLDNCGNLCNAITNDLGPYPTSLMSTTNYEFNNHESAEYWITISADNNTPANIYMTGTFWGSSVIFGCSPQPCTPYTLTKTGNSEIFLVKFDDNLNSQWATSAAGTSTGNTNLDFANSINVNCNDIYIT